MRESCVEGCHPHSVAPRARVSNCVSTSLIPLESSLIVDKIEIPIFATVLAQEEPTKNGSMVLETVLQM